MSSAENPSKTEEEAPKPEETVATGEAPEETGSSKGKGKGKGKAKKPKKKRLSKKERARLRKEQAEKERQEQELRDAQMREQREREYEQKKREEQQQRLLEEDHAIKELREERMNEGRRIHQTQAEIDDMEIFRQCNHFIDVRSQADVNTFFSTWRAQEETDLPTLFEHIHQSNTIRDQLKDIMQRAEVFQDDAEFKRCKQQIEEAQNVIAQKIEQITVHHLVFSDKFAGAKNEVQVSNSADGYMFGMWVNLSKNPRNKEIEFPGVVIEIPKAVAMTSIAIRIQKEPIKPFTKDYLFLDSIFKCEFLQLPPPTKHIGTITLRQSPYHNALVNITYPLRNITAAQPPLNFTLQLPDSFITEYTKDATAVMLTGNTVNTQHISKVALDPEQNVLKFCSMAVGTFAIAVPRYKQFPFQFWEITSISETSIEIYIRTQLAEIALEVTGEGKVSMVSPFEFTGLTPVAALEFLSERGINLTAPDQIDKIPPKTPDLEAVLHRGIADTAAGFHVMASKWNAMLPADRAMLLVRQMKTFDEDEEEHPGFSKTEGAQANFAGTQTFHERSASNASFSNPNSNDGKVASGQNSSQNVLAAANASQSLLATNANASNAANYANASNSAIAVNASNASIANGEEEESLDRKGWSCILAKSNHIIQVPVTEDKEECDTHQVTDTPIHQHIFPMFMDGACEEVKDRVKKAPSFLSDAVLYLLNQFRLFSMTQ